MPARRTSPRRAATRPSLASERYDWTDDDVAAGGVLAGAGPWLGVLALVLAVGALGVVVLRGSGDGDLTACRTRAWAAVPKQGIPTGWLLGTTDMDANGITVSIVGPAPEDGSNPPVVYATVTCYGAAAAQALEANRKAAEAAGATVQERQGGDDAWDISNKSTNSGTTIFRAGDLVAQIAFAGGGTPTDLDRISDAVATAMGDQNAAGTGTGIAAAPSGSDEPLPSDGASESAGPPFAPELEAAMPTSVDDPNAPGTTIPLTVDSASASDIFSQSNDPGSRALAARIRSLGKKIDDLQYAESFDQTGAIAVGIRGFRLAGVKPGQLRDAIVETWLSSTAAGVKTETVTVGGKSVVRIDYGDGSDLEYVYATGDIVIDVETSDAKIAAAVLSTLK